MELSEFLQVFILSSEAKISKTPMDIRVSGIFLELISVNHDIPFKILSARSLKEQGTTYKDVLKRYHEKGQGAFPGHIDYDDFFDFLSSNFGICRTRGRRSLFP